MMAACLGCLDALQFAWASAASRCAWEAYSAPKVGNFVFHDLASPVAAPSSDER